MKLLKNFAFAALAIAAIGFTGCEETDPCEGLTIPEGYICEDGVIVEDPDAVSDETVVISGFITENTTWTADKIYELAGKVVVDDGATLTIEPGTIVKGREGTGTLASALVVARGSKINACGTADEPIIFTSVLDNISIGELSGTNLTEIDNEKWGGLVICGAAPVSTGDGDVEGQIEGIPADEEYGKYGGDDAADNSGSLCYISIRHGGALIGEGNEINGLTLGGVGTGTTIDHVEIVGNLDDGIECFGGTVNISNVIVAFQGDDALDIDQNYSGTISNFYVVHGGDTDEGMEIDGPEGSTYTTGKFTLTNGTIRTVDGEGSAADLKSKAQGTIENVVFSGYSKFVKVSASFNDDCTVKTDAYDRAIGGDLNVQNCEFIGASDMYSVYTKAEDCWDAVAETYNTNLDNAWSGNGNTSPASATIGADISELTGWSWADANGYIQ
jgi:hypothetical protein